MNDTSNRVLEPETKRAIINRLRRAEGQLAAAVKAVEEDAGCRTVVQRSSAVSKALDRAGFVVISSALEECLADPDSEEGMSPKELERLFLSVA